MTILGYVLGFSVVTVGDPAVGTYVIPGTSPEVRISLRREIAPLLVSFAARFNAAVEKLRPADTGGHNPRYIAGTTQWSRHGAAVAMDFNWQRHPMGDRNTFTPSQEATILELLEEYTYEGRQLFRWGGTYASTVDEMHFEVNQPRDFVLEANEDFVRNGGFHVITDADAARIARAVWTDTKIGQFNGTTDATTFGQSMVQVNARTNYLANFWTKEARDMFARLLTAIEDVDNPEAQLPSDMLEFLVSLKTSVDALPPADEIADAVVAEIAS